MVSAPVKLAEGNTVFEPQLTPDGRWVFYASYVKDSMKIRKVPLDGGESVQVTEEFAGMPTVSPDGRLLVHIYVDKDAKKLRLVVSPLEGGGALKTFDIPPTSVSLFRWSSDGNALRYIDIREGVSNIWSLPMDGGEPKPLTAFKSGEIFWFDWSRDGKRLALARGAMTSDAVLIKYFR